MKRIFILLYVGLAFAWTSCEKKLSLDIPENDEWGITLNAIASPDTTFRAYVTHAYLNSEAPEFNYPTYIYDDIYKERDPFKHYYAGYIHPGVPYNDNNYKTIKKSILADAKVDLTVNGKTTYPMTYNDSISCFLSNYRPTIGDHLEVKVSSATGEQTIAHTQVPHPQKLEILDVKLENGEKPDWLGVLEYKGNVKMKLRLHDPDKEKNYYRLRVRTIVNIKDSLYSVYDIYNSSALIFRDERLISNWGAFEAYFSDVFDDRMINGSQYEFDIETYAFHYPNNKQMTSFEVSLQSITEDYYQYLKSLQLYRISTINIYGEPVYIHTNNEGGWGMLGALSGEVHRVKIPEE